MKKNLTLNDMFRAAKIEPGQPGSIWVEKKACTRCGQVIWFHEDGHDGSLRTPQLHICCSTCRRD